MRGTSRRSAKRKAAEDDVPFDEQAHKEKCRKRREDLEFNRDEEIMRLFSFPEEHHELVKRLHYCSTFDMTPEEIHNAYILCGINYYFELNVMPPKDFQRIVLWAMLSVDNIDSKMLMYVGSRM